MLTANSIETDFLLIIVRSLIRQRPNIKIILMSATMNAKRFSDYFSGAPIVTVPGRTFPVKALFLEDSIELTAHECSATLTDNDIDSGTEEEEGRKKSGYVGPHQEDSVSTLDTLRNYDEYRLDYGLIMKLIETIATKAEYLQFSKAILVFLPGMAEIRRMHQIITSNPLFDRDWRVHALHSTLANEDQRQAFEVPTSGIRKIVLATNIAETGITIPDITAVIDTGKHKEMRFDERRQISRLVQSFVSRANAEQRRGRAGRVREGICFHLFTRHRYSELMAAQQTPEILRLSLQELVMRVKICKLGGIEETLASAPDPPSAKNVRRAIDALIEVGALSKSEKLTPLGRQLAKFPLDAAVGKLVIFGVVFRSLDVALTLAAILSSKSPFLETIGEKQRADASKSSFKHENSDLLTAYNAYTAWRRVCNSNYGNAMDFARRNFLNAKNLTAIEDVKDQLLMLLAEARFIAVVQAKRKKWGK
jgi:ATP-dependent RNA helicase DHX29